MVSFIVATARNGVIGKEGGLPWNLPGEMALFKRTTMGHPIIMGRTTHEKSIGGRALPGRTNIIVTHNPEYSAEGCVVVASIDEALEKARSSEGADEIFIIGGESIYRQSMDYVDRIYLTRVDANIPGDKFFKYNPDEWKPVSSEKHQKDEKNPYDFEFAILERESKS